uniref:Transmembrane protein n=1 Tax=Ditylum brightwellii TaxID=49249 RepID=A0A6V2EML4_9STRA
MHEASEVINTKKEIVPTNSFQFWTPIIIQRRRAIIPKKRSLLAMLFCHCITNLFLFLYSRLHYFPSPDEDDIDQNDPIHNTLPSNLSKNDPLYLPTMCVYIQ